MLRLGKIRFILLSISFFLLLCNEADENSNIIFVPEDYLTIQQAIDIAPEGATILISPGQYYENLLIEEKNIILASKYIVCRNKEYKENTIIDGSGDTVIRVSNAVDNLVKIIGLTIRNGNDGISTDSQMQIDNNIIFGCIDGIDYEGGGGDCTNNIFENNMDDGIDLDGTVNINICNNIIRNNLDDGIESRLHEYSGNILNIIIKANDIYGNGEDGIQLIDYPDFSDRKFEISYNLIYDNAMAGIGCMSDGNTVENYEGAPIPERIIIYNNTINNNYYGITGGANLFILNNIVMNCSVDAAKNVNGESIISYSCFWNNGNNFNNCIVENSNIILDDPLIDSEYNITTGSPCVDKGVAQYLKNGEEIIIIPASSYNGAHPVMGAKEYSF